MRVNVHVDRMDSEEALATARGLTIVAISAAEKGNDDRAALIHSRADYYRKLGLSKERDERLAARLDDSTGTF